MLHQEAKSRRDVFIEDLLARNYTTYFAVTHPKFAAGNKAFRFTSSPISIAVPYSWRYREARQLLFELGDLLTTDEAERRNINFVNPTLATFMPAATLPTLRGGIQLLLPGEKAYTHRHSANAFRFVLEAPQDGVCTVVEGYKIPMRPGDLVITPNWTWHDHHNESDSHAIWYDGLDVMMAYWIGATFFQEHEDVAGAPYQKILREATDMMHRYGPGLLHRKSLFPEHVPVSDNSLLYYPYSRAREALQGLLDSGSVDERDGILIEYVNPVNAGSTFPSMDNCLRMIPAKTELKQIQRTENIVFVTMEGSVRFQLPDQEFETQPFDVTAIPSWVPYRIANSGNEPAVLFSNSDRPLFTKLGFYREADPSSSAK